MMSLARSISKRFTYHQPLTWEKTPLHAVSKPFSMSLSFSGKLMMIMTNMVSANLKCTTFTREARMMAKIGSTWIKLSIKFKREMGPCPSSVSQQGIWHLYLKMRILGINICQTCTQLNSQQIVKKSSKNTHKKRLWVMSQSWAIVRFTLPLLR